MVGDPLITLRIEYGLLRKIQGSRGDRCDRIRLLVGRKGCELGRAELEQRGRGGAVDHARRVHHPQIAMCVEGHALRRSERATAVHEMRGRPALAPRQLAWNGPQTLRAVRYPVALV